MPAHTPLHRHPAATRAPFSQVTGPNDVVEFSQADSVGSKFSFTASSGGSHSVCFANGSGAKRAVELEWAAGAAAIDYADVAKVEQLKPLELEMRKLEDRLAAVRREMQFQREREESHRDLVRFVWTAPPFFLAARAAHPPGAHTPPPGLLGCLPACLPAPPPPQSEVTNSRVMWFSALTVVIVIASSFFQVRYLKSFFKANKFL